MQVFDFNIHLPYVSHNDVNQVIENDMNLNEEGLLMGIDFHKKSFDDLAGANFLLFNTNLFSRNISYFRKETEKHLEKVSITALIDFRRQDIKQYLENVKVFGGQFVMVNSYLQKINQAEYPKVIEALSYAASIGLSICIDGSYGTSRMFVYDNIELACEVANEISDTPIVIIHSGGLRVLKAMLLALDKENVWLDTSFSLPYYLGSSLETDFAFAYKKIDCNRVVFGSDIPYLNSSNAIDLHMKFFEKYNFTNKQIQRIMHDNAKKLLNI